MPLPPLTSGNCCEPSQPIDERADREERHVAEVEQPGEADHDVQPERHDDVGERRDRRVEQVVGAARSAGRSIGCTDRQRERDRWPPRPVRQLPRTERPVRAQVAAARAHPSRASSPNRPCGLEDHDQDQDRRTRSPGSTPGRDAVVGDRLDDADHEAADDRALEVADAAHHGGGERDQAGREALVELDRAVVDRVDQPGRAGEHAAEQERQRDRAVDVDAHQPRGVRVLRGRAHRLAVARARRRTTAARSAAGP